MPNNDEDNIFENDTDNEKKELSENRIKEAANKTDTDNDNELNIDKNKSNVNNNYQRANSAKEAFNNRKNNKNFYKNKQEENSKRLEAAKERQKEAKNKVNNSKKGVNENSTKDKLKSAKKPFSNRSLGGSKTKEEKEQSKKDKKELKDANNELKEAKQERKDIIRDRIQSKAYELTHPFEAAKEKLKRKIIGIVIVGFVIFFIVEFIIAVVMNFIDVALEGLDNAANGVANIHEKTDNFFNGLGFQNSEDAFYEELNYLNRKYDGELDIPLLMSTIFYDDIHSNDDNAMNIENIDDEESLIWLGVAMSWLKSWISDKVHESNVTIGADGFEYSSNKIYRMRLLAKNQFSTAFLGTVAVTSTEKTMGLLEYAKQCLDQIGDELYQFFESLLPNILTYLNPLESIQVGGNIIEDLYDVLFKGEKLYTTDTYNILIGDGSITHLLSLFKTIFTSFSDVTDISFTHFGIGEKTCDELICITYKTYEFSEENYKNYLKKSYVPKMPEFRKYISSKDDAIKEKEIDTIVREIFDLAEEYQDIFGLKKRTSELYTNSCTGNIDMNLVSELALPVDVQGGITPSFSSNYGFGTSNGKSHKGLDFNSKTTGNNEGDEVYSIYSNGKVIKSSKDDDYKCNDCFGGWLEINYIVVNNDNTFDFKIIYGGLDPDSVILKSGDIVQKGNVIGKIGSKENSEDKDIPSLHFGFYDNTSNTYLNPTNMFIPCTLINDPNARIVTISSDVLQMPQFNYSVTCYWYDGWDLSCDAVLDTRKMSKSSNQKIVHNLWMEAGQKYTNGIATVKIDGIDRYLVATTSTFGETGDLINATLENGEVIPMLIADIKDPSDPNWTTYGHLSGTNNNYLSVLEFEVDPYKVLSSGINPSSWGQNWDTSQKVVSVTINHSAIK